MLARARFSLLLSVLLLVSAGCSQQESGSGRSAPSESASSAGTPRPTDPVPELEGEEPGDRLDDALPGRTDVSAAARAASRLSLYELAGQVIVARYGGTAAPVGLVRDLHLGGVIVFDDNVTSTGQIAGSNRTLRRQIHRPLFVGVDQEGGVVERVQGRATRFPAFMSAGAADDPALTRAAARASGAELNGLGFVGVFAPDADVTSGPDDPTIGSRSAGASPALVSRHVLASLAGFTSTGVLPVVKHFPGHGSVPADSHEVLPVQKRTRATLAKVDMAPFRKAVEAGAPAIMVGHIDVRAIDAGTPASLSRKVITGVLRRQLGFTGLIVTDALDMAGISNDNGSRAAAVKALRAGADVLLMPAEPVAARDAIVQAVRNGSLRRDRLEDAATRVLSFLIHQQKSKQVTAKPGSGAKASANLSSAAITMVAGPCRGRLVGPRVHVTGGDAEQVAALRAAAERAGLKSGSRGSEVSLIGWQGAPVEADVAVALDTPYALGSSQARTKIATFGDTPGAMDALVQVLLGKARAPGRLPVQISGAGKGC
ncbi:MAG: hypothetical protein L0H93_02245 [Nocardioides sp.]|nr:hypothetical protein [Nocardioides sp.]